MVLSSPHFDLSLVWFIRSIVKNFILTYPHVELNLLRIDIGCMAELTSDEPSLDEFLLTMVLCMGKEA